MSHNKAILNNDFVMAHFVKLIRLVKHFSLECATQRIVTCGLMPNKTLMRPTLLTSNNEV